MLKKMLVILAGISLLAGCGGGGDGGGGGTGLPATYTGNTTQATVTTANARTLSESAYGGVAVASDFSAIARQVNGTSNVTGSSTAPSPLLAEVASILDNSVSTIAQKPSTSAKILAAVTDQRTIYGFTGNFSYSISADTNSGAFNGTFQFNNYMDSSASVAMNGTVSFSGYVNTTTGALISFRMGMVGMNVVDGSSSFNMEGTVTANISGTIRTIAMTMAVTDNSTHLTEAVKDYTVTINGSLLSLSGLYYDHTHGYVVISTVSPLTVSTLSSTPTSGQLLFTGSNGTKARMTFTSTGYTVEVDTAGNGNFTLVP